jgi:adenine-specific DNA-methyltransferase
LSRVIPILSRTSCLNEIKERKVGTMPTEKPIKSKKDPADERRKKFGQYFTTDTTLQQFIFDKVQHKGHLLLEPSFGTGSLLSKFLDFNKAYPIMCYEIDKTLKPLVSFNTHQTVVYADFLNQEITQKFKTIIGNPPYVRQKGTMNLYISFIEQCYSYLADDGELLFIVPSDFLKLTSAGPILKEMTTHGTFTDFLFPNDEKLFDHANIDVAVFRYQKGIKQETTKVNGKEVFCMIKNGIITFSDTQTTGTSIQELFDVYVGLVSGRDEIYKQSFGNIQVLNDKEKVDTYIFTETFPTTNDQINAHLVKHKATLLERKIKKFSDTNWYEWGAPRNLKRMISNKGKQCIYVRNMTRNKEVAFKGTVQYFGGSLLCLIPKSPLEDRKIDEIIEYLNTPTFQSAYLYAGRFKIGHKQVCNVILPN